ncbi:MAG TPA: hypothetical protein VHV55_14680 [Pirellulales bacterium]|nr:hypothetical protein [Pirellulales bacterium]
MKDHQLPFAYETQAAIQHAKDLPAVMDWLSADIYARFFGGAFYPFNGGDSFGEAVRQSVSKITQTEPDLFNW